MLRLLFSTALITSLNSTTQAQQWELIHTMSVPEASSIALRGDLLAIGSDGVRLYARHHNGWEQWGQVDSMLMDGTHNTFPMAFSPHGLIVGNGFHSVDDGGLSWEQDIAPTWCTAVFAQGDRVLCTAENTTDPNCYQSDMYLREYDPLSGSYALLGDLLLSTPACSSGHYSGCPGGVLGMLGDDIIVSDLCRSESSALATGSVSMYAWVAGNSAIEFRGFFPSFGPPNLDLIDVGSYGRSTLIMGDTMMVGYDNSNCFDVPSSGVAVFFRSGSIWVREEQVPQPWLSDISEWQNAPIEERAMGHALAFEGDDLFVGRQFGLAHFQVGDSSWNHLGTDTLGGAATSILIDGDLMAVLVPVSDTPGEPAKVFIYARQDHLRIAARVYLEGAFDEDSGTMRDDLRTLPGFPLTEPYSSSGWPIDDGGGETLLNPDRLNTEGADAIVDWVRVELRDEIDPSTVVAVRYGLLQRDGAILDMDGSAALRFNASPGNYHVAVRHRNHLGCMTAASTPWASTVGELDLTQNVIPLHGTDPVRVVNGIRMLWAGNSVPDALIKYTGSQNDRDEILEEIGGSTPTATTNGYLNADVNMDGMVKYTGASNDRDAVLQGVGGTVPTATRTEQLP